MEAYVLDWVNLLLRWAHVIVAIAWIGSSFYFVFLDNSLTKPSAPDLVEKGVDGELWAVHGGGFYHPQKYMVAPKSLPPNLHWFYWESYSTWLTGFALFTVLYLYQAGTFLIDRNLYAWSPAGAIAAALGFLVVFWAVYDAICRVFGQREGGDRIVGIGVTITVILASWLACQLFAGRAAFLLVGAMLATAMSANVFFWIIPGQRTVMAQMKAGQPVDPVHGQRAKQRSVHNTYFTLPVLIAMLSNHYGFLYGAQHNWLVLVLVMLAGALIRHSFVARHKALVAGKRVPWEYAVVGTALIVALALWLAPAPAAKSASAAPPSFAQVRALVEQRCAMCHNEQVISKGVQLHTPELIAKNAQALYQQAVVLKAMPLNNATQITDEERSLLGRWYEAGAASR
ncbi:MAG: urate hydroxylase PuuD [Piscinibacter sp.]|uniref:urate hydroxylase PuuD n=1 Tax=Piscinibacter sp. TaxID=1903157 RepID=UPI001B688808|nr:urate hydroxylase PuuD [Piscinibacter sp.]MBP5988527.1 urate hydroxylase PuuD [Piscinibacter sp.]MBP6025985.1 urate hydroxylase PuuD [Piscinibacter sp.]